MSAPGGPVLAFDFCGVLGLQPGDAARARVERFAGRSGPAFWADYWAHRVPYDIGRYGDLEYWALVAPGADIGPVVEADTAMWTTPNTELFELIATLPGTKAILSNAPAPLAQAIDTGPWARTFAHRVFSADIGVAKPDPASFRILCERLRAAPHEVVFVDDRQENVDGAVAAGLHGLLFTDVPSLAAALPAR